MKCVVPECKGLAVYGPRCAACRELAVRRCLHNYAPRAEGDLHVRKEERMDVVRGALVQRGRWDGDDEERLVRL